MDRPAAPDPVRSGLPSTNLSRAYPVRTCLGCRARGLKSELVRIVSARDGGLVVDLTQTSPGRGAYLHDSVVCLRQAVRRRPWGRALRAEVDGNRAEQELRAQLSSIIPVVGI